MVFVRWHYRAGVYVCCHYRRRRRDPPDGQEALTAWASVDGPR